MRITTHLILAATILMNLAGCDGGSSSPVGKVAMVDLQRIAQALGRDTSIRDQVNEHRQQMQQMLQSRLQQLEAELSADREKLGDDPTEEEQNVFARRTVELRQNYQAEAAKAEQQRRAKEAQLIQEFREYVGPYVQRTARHRGFTITLTRSDLVIAMDPSVDITDDVIVEMSKGLPLSDAASTTTAPALPTTTPAQP